MLLTFVKGLGLGLVLASATLLFVTPPDHVVVTVPSDHPGVFAVETPVSGWRLPAIEFVGDQKEQPHHSVERILMRDGKLGVRVLIMNPSSPPRPQPQWI